MTADMYSALNQPGDETVKTVIVERLKYDLGQRVAEQS